MNANDSSAFEPATFFPRLLSPTRLGWLAVLASSLLFLATGLWAFSGHEAICDELCHYFDGIAQILNGNFTTPACFSTFPGYHLASASVMKLLGLSSLFHARAVTALWGLGIATAAYAGAHESSRAQRFTRALLVFTQPLIAPYYFLTYTDTFAVFLGLAAFIAFERKNSAAATLLGAAAVYTRQTQIVWIAFFVVLALIEEDARTRAGLGRALRRCLGPLLVLAGLGAWAFHHGGFSVGVRDIHPNFKVTFGNIWFLLGLLPLLFLPYLIESGPRLLALLRRHLALCLMATAVLSAIFVLTLRVDHPFNAIEPEFYRSFLHNRILNWSVQNQATRALSFVPVLLGSWLLWDWPFREGRYRWVLPLFFGLLTQQWLIEQRYYMPLVAFLVFARESVDAGTERLQLVWQIALCALAVWGMARDVFLL